MHVIVKAVDKFILNDVSTSFDIYLGVFIDIPHRIKSCIEKKDDVICIVDKTFELVIVTKKILVSVSHMDAVRYSYRIHTHTPYCECVYHIRKHTRNHNLQE